MKCHMKGNKSLSLDSLHHRHHQHHFNRQAIGRVGGFVSTSGTGNTTSEYLDNKGQCCIKKERKREPTECCFHTLAFALVVVFVWAATGLREWVSGKLSIWFAFSWQASLLVSWQGREKHRNGISNCLFARLLSCSPVYFWYSEARERLGWFCWILFTNPELTKQLNSELAAKGMMILNRIS